jgi:hypothetical protein
MANATHCIVCSNEKANYRCPGCRSKYCSVGCFAAHKSSSQCDGTLKPVGAQPRRDAAEGIVTVAGRRRAGAPVEELLHVVTAEALERVTQLPRWGGVEVAVVEIKSVTHRSVQEVMKFLEDRRKRQVITQHAMGNAFASPMSV